MRHAVVAALTAFVFGTTLNAQLTVGRWPLAEVFRERPTANGQQPTEVKLGPEVPLSPTLVPRAAAFDQTAPAAASNGTDFLVAWADGRRLGSDIYVTRAGSDGQPIDPFGRRIGSGTNPRIASAGGDSLVVWQSGPLIQSVRLDPNGAPRAAARTVGSGTPVALASNGSTYLLVMQSSALLLDSNGAPLRTIANPFTTPLGAASFGGRYFIVGNGPSMILRAIDGDGTASDTVLPVLPRGDEAIAATAFAPTEFLLAWSTGHCIVMAYDGSVVRDLTLLNVDPKNQIVAAGWDGKEFLAAFGTMAAFRIAADGSTSGNSFPISTATSASGLTFASSGASELVVWSETREFTADIVARSAASFSALAANPAPATLLSVSGDVQADLALARGPRGTLAAWDDGDPRWLRVSASFNGGAPTILDSVDNKDYVGWPAVAAGANVFLVVWQHLGTGVPLNGQLLAKRFDLDGNVLDAQPIVLLGISMRGTQVTRFEDVPSVVFDGAQFVVGWAEDKDLYTVHVPESGSHIDVRQTPAAKQAEAVHHAVAFASGGEVFVAFQREGFCTVNIGCVKPLSVALAHFDRAGNSISQTPEFAAPFDATPTAHYGAALAPNGITFAWQGGFDGTPSLFVREMTRDGELESSPFLVVSRAANDGVTPIKIIWNGTEYVLVWLDRIAPDGNAYTLKAIRLDVNLHRIDDAPFVVATGTLSAPPALIATSTGVLIAYSRPDDSNAGAPMAFTRSLDRVFQPAPPRRRTIR